jgi:hypothetical protein
MPSGPRKRERRSRSIADPVARRVGDTNPLLPRTATLVVLALTPVVLARGTLNSFEFPKTELLLIAVLALIAWWIAGEVTSAASEGAWGWARSLPRRAWASARSDPAGAAVILFLISAVASTVASINPTLSLHGAADSHAGLPIALV